MSSGSSTKNRVEKSHHSSYSHILNMLPAAVYICDAQGYVTYFNEAAAKLWGRRPEIGRDLWCGSWKIYEANGQPLSLDACPMAETLRTKKPVAGRNIIIEQPNGQRFHVLPHPHPIFDDKGVMTGAINMLVDVTDQNKFQELQVQTARLSETAEALKKSEERYHQMIAEVEDYAIILLTPEGVIENWNKGAEKIKGYSEKEALGKSFRMFYTDEDQKNGMPDRLLQEARETGHANHEGWRVRKDGTLFWGSISITALHGRTGEVIGFSKVTRDLTERRKHEHQIEKFLADMRRNNEELRLSEARYHRIVAEVEDYVIILLDLNGRIQNWNKGAQKIKGYDPEEIIGKHFSVFYSAEDREKGIPERLLATALKEGKATHEGYRVRKGRSTFWGSVVITAIHADDGTVIGFTKVTRDLTEKKHAEEKLLATSIKLEQKNKELERINEELSSFAYISSHDLQEPLRKIQTFSDRIIELEHNNLSEKGKDYLKRMQGGALRMQRLIRDILAYSRTTTSEKILEMTDLNSLLAQSKVELEVAILEKKATIESDRLPTLKVIPFQIQQLFNNLLSNALKFVKPDMTPHIVIRSEIVDGKSLKDTFSQPAGRYCHLRFTDDGIGFEPQYNKKIFEVFQRLHGRLEYSGTGIGLAICKKIVENHNGMISAESEVNNGATFHVYLPIVD